MRWLAMACDDVPVSKLMKCDIGDDDIRQWQATMMFDGGDSDIHVQIIVTAIISDLQKKQRRGNT